VVLSDFGLARTTTAVGSATHTKVIAGTPAYMAPEQFETGECSIASDVYAFGVVCFEMLTGQRQPLVPARSIRPELDPRWEDFILRCVSQDPRKRPANAEALIEELRGLSGRRRLRLTAVPYLAFALVLGIAAFAIWTAWPSIGRGTKSPEFTRLTMDAGLSCEPSASRDGRTIVYSSDVDGVFQLWIQRLPDGERVQLTHGSSHAVNPAISPDGTMVAFRREYNEGGIYVLPARGGAERRLAPQGRHPRFSPDGSQIVFWTGSEGDHTFASGKLWLANVATGAVRPLHHQLVDARFPAWSPDGRFIVFRASATPGPAWDQRSDWWISDVEGRAATPTTAFSRLSAMRLSLHDGGITWGPGQLLFPARAGHSTNLWRLPMSDETGKVDGQPERLTSGSNLETSPWPLGSEFVAYTNWEVSGQIWRVWTKGPRAGTAEAVTETDALDTRPAVSAAGTRLMFTRRLGEIRNLWIKEMSGGRESQVLPGIPLVPALSPDGQSVAYSVADGLKKPIFLIGASGGDRRQLCEDCGDVQVWSMKGDAVLFLKHGAQNEHSLEAVDVSSQQVRTLVRGEGLTEGTLSPDGQHVTFVLRSEGTRSRVYVAPHAAASDRRSWRAVTSATDWADKPRWDPDGRALYFYSEQDGFGCLWRQPMADGKPSGAAEAVQHLHDAQHAIFHLSRQAFGLSAGPDFVVYNVPTVKGNIWKMDYPQPPGTWNPLRRWFGGGHSTASR
jgi:Tol biopolymer transport system component